jgi:hypothetical protein
LIVMPNVKPIEAVRISGIGFMKKAATATRAGLPRDTIVPARMVARNIPSKP